MTKLKKVLCWLLGHDKGGRMVPESRLMSSGEMGDCWQYYCKRCQDPENFPINQPPDIRNLYRRTIPPRIMRWQNMWHFRNVKRDWERNRPAHLQYLAEQMKIYGGTDERRD